MMRNFPQQQFFVSVSSLYLIKTITSHTILPQMTIKNVCRAWTTPGLCNLLPASAPHCPGNPIQLFGNDDVLLGCAPPTTPPRQPSLCHPPLAAHLLYNALSSVSIPHLSLEQLSAGIYRRETDKNSPMFRSPLLSQGGILLAPSP